MMTLRALTLLVTTALFVGGDVGDRIGGRFAGHSAGGAAQETAQALLAEARELCEGTESNPVPHPGTAALVARMAAGQEALTISTEVAQRIGDRGIRTRVLEAAGAIRKSCRFDGGSSDVRTDEARARAGEGRSGALGGVRGGDRSILIAPFIGRLGEAATVAVASRPVPVPAGDDPRMAEPVVSPNRPKASERVASSEAAEPVALSEAESARPQSARANEPTEPVLVLEIGASERHLRRVAEWAPVFRRNAGLLRTARGALQREIEAYSVAESRRVCRAFGRTLDGLDPQLGQAAPSRELSLRVERMMASYRRGASECVSGRAAAAYSYLSEGDREWSALARSAARVLEPRSARVLR